jgi:hypothetical protein
MSKLVRFVDFQVYVLPASLVNGEQRRINEALFAAYEPVRLWLKEQMIRAPFRKIVVSLTDEDSAAQWHGHVSSAAGICEVTETVAMPTLAQKAGDHRWVLGIVQHALGCISQTTGWRSEELESFVAKTMLQPSPLVHVFEGLRKVDRESGVTCVPWLSVRPGETLVGVRVGERSETVVSHAGPLYLEDDFPLAKTAFHEENFVLFDSSGRAIARIAINKQDVE